MASMDAEDLDTIVGCTDGFRKGYIEGWAWRPNRPHDTVVVQLFVDGLLAGEASACLPRPDLSTAGIGHGQHAFAIPLVIEPHSPPIMHLTVRAKDGPVLPEGEIDFATSEETRAELALRRSLGHLETVFGALTPESPEQSRDVPSLAAPILNFVLYATRGRLITSTALGAPEYSYVFVMQGYRDVLRRLGVVHIVHDPKDADAIFGACLERGESCLLFSFTPPQNTPLGLRCPTIPVIAWEFGSIPTGGWPGDKREDWRYVLRQTGRAITISQFAANAIRATMGAAFPAASVPTPVWDRQARLRSWLIENDAVRSRGTGLLSFDGFAWDSRTVILSADMRTPAPSILQPQQAVKLPIRGAQLSLAEASAAVQRDLARMAQQGATARSDAQGAIRQGLPAENGPVAHRANSMMGPATLDDGNSSRTTMPLANDRTARVVAFLSRQWRRKVIHDVLPARVARIAEAAARVVLARTSAQPHGRISVNPDVMPLPLASNEISQGVATDFDAEVRNAGSVPAANGFESGNDTALPPTARYLPVGDPDDPESVAAPPRYLPAPDDVALPEPELAIFIPDPHPKAQLTTRGRTNVRLDGLIFAAVLSPKDGRKNWQDILTAFCTVFQHADDVTLVLKMIGNDPAFWWWEFHDIVKALPPFACRVVVINGFLDEEAYWTLVAATHFIVNASLAEGQCLPLVEFMSASRPAIAPQHTAMHDYITQKNAIIVQSSVEFCSFPHDPRNMLTTTRHRISWPSLCDAFEQAADILRNDPGRYASLAEHAASDMRSYCSDERAAQALAAFLGFGDEAMTRAGWRPQARTPAEPLLTPFTEGDHCPAESVA